jgi:hypothetical protein
MFLKCRLELKHPISATCQTKKQQYFSIASLQTDLVIVDHAVQFVNMSDNKILSS